MYKFSANLGLLWTEMSQIDAIYKAKDKVKAINSGGKLKPPS